MAKMKKEKDGDAMTTQDSNLPQQQPESDNIANTNGCGSGDESAIPKASPPPHVTNSNNIGMANSCSNGTMPNKSSNSTCTYYYLTADARQHLPQYQYRGCDCSLLYKYILSPLAEWLVQNCVPRSMAPNTVTLIGLMGMISSYLLYWWYHCGWPFLRLDDDNDTHTDTHTPTLSPPPPNWIYLYNAMAMLAYQTLDNMDGKQARRTKSSSPLGLLFDHGCDAINSIFGSANWILGMGLVMSSTLQLEETENDFAADGDDNNHSTASSLFSLLLLQSFVLIFGPFAMFYVATWEQYHTGELILPIINGPNEGLLGGVLLSVTSYWYGPAYWQGYEWSELLVGVLSRGGGILLPPPPLLRLRNCDFVILASSIGFVQEIVLKTITVVLSHDKNKKYKAPPTSGSTATTTTTINAAAIQSLLPFVWLSVCFFVLGVYQPNLLLCNPRTALHLAMFLFVEMSTELMLAHVTAQPFHTWRRWQLLPLMVLTIWVVVSAEFISFSEDDDKLQYFQYYYTYYTYYLTAYTWSMGGYLIVKCVMVVREICNVLQIWCFDIVTPYDKNRNGTTSREGTLRRRRRRTIRGGHVPTKPIKTVYLIRHAESKENERMASLSRVVRSLAKFQFPRDDDNGFADVWAAMELLNVYGQVDSPVSCSGAQQIATMRRTLDQTNFLEVANIELVAHSPLIRACQTCEGMLGCIGGETAAVQGAKAPKTTNRVARVLETDRLIEKSPMEWTPLRYHRFLDRIDDLEAWLWDQNEESVALVGHSQFFKAMLGLDFKFGNCDVWKVQFDLAAKSRPATICGENNNDNKDGQWILPPQWSNLELLHPCHHRPHNKSD